MNTEWVSITSKGHVWRKGDQIMKIYHNGEAIGHKIVNMLLERDPSLPYITSTFGRWGHTNVMYYDYVKGITLYEYVTAANRTVDEINTVLKPVLKYLPHRFSLPFEGTWSKDIIVNVVDGKLFDFRFIDYSYDGPGLPEKFTLDDIIYFDIDFNKALRVYFEIEYMVLCDDENITDCEQLAWYRVIQQFTGASNTELDN